MATHTVIPGLTVTDEQYEAAAAGLARHVPDLLALSWETFSNPASWWLVPGPDDDIHGTPIAYKAELLLEQVPERTTKVNIWSLPDLRDGETPKPHNHPWEVMEAHPVLGSYADHHWHRSAGGLLVDRSTVYNRTGDLNRIFARDYHEVVEVEHGTVSVMVCGRWIHDEDRQGVWGHLDLTTGEHVPVSRDEGEQAVFTERLYRINPQHRKG